jgi:DNA-binding HxlR family transcriptional regulator
MVIVPTIPVQIRYGPTERGRDFIVALRLSIKWENGANR